MSTTASEKSDRLKAEARDLCPACEQTIWLSFYFDGFGMDMDGDAMSNIAVLSDTALRKPERGIYAFYYPGLGTPFDPEASRAGPGFKRSGKRQGQRPS